MSLAGEQLRKSVRQLHAQEKERYLINIQYLEEEREKLSANLLLAQQINLDGRRSIKEVQD